MRFLSLILSAGLCLTIWTGCSSKPAAHPALKQFVVALKPDKDPEKMAAEREALAAYFTERLGVPTQVVIPLSAAAIQEGLANGTIDIGYLSATDMVTARDRGTATILAVGEIRGQPSYPSYWVALADKPYTSVADLKGKPIAFASKTSTSGCLIPHWDLVKKGFLQPGEDPELFFGTGHVFYGTGYVSAIEQVLNGRAEAAAVSYYVLDEDKHLTADQRARLKKIAEQGPVPTHVIAVRTSLPEAALGPVRDAVFALNEPAHQALRDKVFTSKLIARDTAEHLAGIEEALRLTGKK